MLTELLYPLQDGFAPLYLAVVGDHTTCVEHLLSTPGIDVNIKSRVSWSILKSNDMHGAEHYPVYQNKTIEQLLLSLHTKTFLSCM